MKVIAIAQHKGGTGKTTTACNLAAGLAIRGHQTLLVDLDSQCNATISYLSPEMITHTLSSVLVTEPTLPLADAIYTTHIAKLDIVPSNLRLANLERFVRFEEQYRLKKCLQTVSNRYEFIILDCPPNLGMVLNQALLAATHILIPVAAEYYPLEGLTDLDTVVVTAQEPNPHLEVLGYLVTRFDIRSGLSRQALQRVKDMHGKLVFQTVIRNNVKLQYAPAFRETIYEHAPRSYGSEDYDALTEEILERLQINRLRMVNHDKPQKATKQK